MALFLCAFLILLLKEKAQKRRKRTVSNHLERASSGSDSFHYLIIKIISRSYMVDLVAKFIDSQQIVVLYDNIFEIQ